jgi:hypothetical protein
VPYRPAEVAGILTMLRKPSWLKASTWGEFCQKYQRSDGSFPCSHPGCLRHADTVDHIKPRSHPDFTELREYIDEDGRKHRQANPAAAHVLENIQPMCRSHNSGKGARPDAYWASDLYFDRPLNADRLRASQRDFIYMRMREAGPQMLGRINQINGKLLSFFQVTGAGKTLGKFALPFGINHGLLAAADHHKPPRIDRVLIVVKEQALRRQITEELRTEPVALGIINTPPVVQEATTSDELLAYSKQPGVQFVITCAQQLWPRENSAIAASRQELFNAFPCIIFDEMHFATEHIRQVVHQATNSLVFGLTASPIDGAGELLEDMVCVSTYGYREACANDNSMKSLGKTIDNPQGDGIAPEFDDLIEEVLPKEVDDLSGATVMRGNEGSGQYSLASAVNVALAVIERLDRLDRMSLTGQPSPHRRLHGPDIETVTASLVYPSHAILRCKDIPTAKFLAEYLNQKLEADRARYPLDQGWRAAVAHSTHDGHRAPLNEESHPWFWSKRNGGKLSAKAARILVVSQMACEGINNKFCNVVAWAHVPATIRKIVQANGRAFRALFEKHGTELLVPHAHLDRVYILSHFNWGRGEQKADRQEALIQALRFFNNPDSLEGLITFDDWLANGDEIQHVDLEDPSVGIGIYDLQKIVSYLAQAQRNGTRVSLRDVYDIVGAKGEKRQAAVREVVQGLDAGNPEVVAKVQQRFGRLTEVFPIGPIATLEKVDVGFEQGDRAVDYITSLQNTDSLLKQYEGNQEELQKVCMALAPLIRGNYFRPQEVAMQQTITDVIRSIAGRIIDNMRLHTHSSRVYQECNRAARIMLSVPKEEKLSKDSRYNIPAVILYFQESSVQGKIAGHVIRVLYDDGFVPEEGYLLGIEDLARNSQEDGDDI